jgi:hypothetical protein
LNSTFGKTDKLRATDIADLNIDMLYSSSPARLEQWVLPLKQNRHEGWDKPSRHRASSGSNCDVSSPHPYVAPYFRGEELQTSIRRSSGKSPKFCWGFRACSKWRRCGGQSEKAPLLPQSGRIS